LKLKTGRKEKKARKKEGYSAMLVALKAGEDGRRGRGKSDPEEK